MHRLLWYSSLTGHTLVISCMTLQSRLVIFVALSLHTVPTPGTLELPVSVVQIITVAASTVVSCCVE